MPISLDKISSACSSGLHSITDLGQQLSNKVQKIASPIWETMPITIGFDTKHAIAAVAMGGLVLLSAPLSTTIFQSLVFATTNSCHHALIVDKGLIPVALAGATLSLTILSTVTKNIGGNWKAVAGGIVTGAAATALLSLEVVPAMCVVAITAGLIAGSKLNKQPAAQ